PMKKLFALILWTAALAPLTAQSQQQPGTLAGFLSGQGLVGAKLERRFENHLFVPVAINSKRAALMIDTGAPVTIIDKNSAGTFGLKVESTTINVGRVFGTRWEHYGVSVAKSIAMGNCMVTNVPAALNGHPTRMIVDTGAAVTTVDRTMASQAGIGIAGTRFVEDAGEGRIERFGTGEVNELKIGDYIIPRATVSVVNVSGTMLHSKSAEESNSGLIGAEYLAWNFAVIDVGGMA